MAIKTICVFCGAHTTIPLEFIDLAQKCGEKIAVFDLALLYGGSKFGLMGAVANSAYSAGAKVIGVYPKILNVTEPINEKLTESLIVETMHSRKEIMINRSDAFVVLPGGVGTLDEIFEVMTLASLGGLNKPIIILNYKGYWNKLKDLMQHIIDERFAVPSIYETFEFVNTVDEIFEKLGFKQ